MLSLAQLKVNRLATAGPCVWRRLSSVCKRARSLLVKGCPSPVISRTGALTALAIGLGAPGITPVGIIWSSGVTGIFILFFSFVKESHFGKVFYFYLSSFFVFGGRNWYVTIFFVRRSKLAQVEVVLFFALLGHRNVGVHTWLVLFTLSTFYIQLFLDGLRFG